MLIDLQESDKHPHEISRSYRIKGKWRAALWRWRRVLWMILFAFLAQSILSAAGELNPQTEKILVAATDLTAGESLSDSSVQQVNIRKDAVPEGYFTNAEKLAGATVAAAIPKGLPITRSQLLNEKFLRAAPPGTAVTSVSLDFGLPEEIAAPGNRIDIYAPANLPGEKLPAETEEDTAEADSGRKDKTSRQPAERENAENTSPRGALLLAEEAIIMGKSGKKEKHPFFGDSASQNVFYVAVKTKDLNAVLGVRGTTPLRAVLRAGRSAKSRSAAGK